MHIEMWRILLLALYGAWSIYDGLNTAIGFKGSAVTGMFVGLIMGDMTTGLVIGGTLQLMSLGIGSYGGASVPDYNTATIISTAFAVTNHMSTGAAIGLAIPISLLAVNFDIFARFVNTFLQHRAEAYADQGKINAVGRMNLLGSVSWSLSRFLPIFVALWLGNGFVKEALAALPQWFMGGLKTAGGILPALGIAILLKYLPLNKYFAFVLIGFALAAYGKIPMIGISIVALAIAMLITFAKSSNGQPTQAQTVANTNATQLGVDEDE
ncbi:PTS mannose/fructose/sorbose/N-acetylgalactosamine transporter subunit IIC [Lacticaseibacillus daqingensis]|uniref:PTS mannose/fructose/sorbose/N-acetylgalactosamine transporter subunit IIC n=1 Tax=Lacticaseibacillus daqingensis TaxID=2486014 RepID=UPI000F790300|nr:PTS sugar transporter subunit IIC [Lacticaseibacillus daqingensis]